MTRRDFLWAAAALPSARPAQVTVPVHRIVDAKARFPRGSLERFWSSIWPEAVIDLGRGGIALQTTDGPGEVGHTAADRPLFTGLRRGVLNLVLSDRLPLYWDNARSLAGVTTLDRGYHLCLIALRYAHGNRVPFLSVNTCAHEILHALLLDIFLARPSAYQAAEREYRIDWYATRLWLFHDGAAVQRSAQAYLDHLRAAS
ncbi:MAG: hypothetical protein WBY44_32295 [Bryobacteraceae bacterium]